MSSPQPPGAFSQIMNTTVDRSRERYDVQSLAHMGAQQLSQLGPEGEALGQQLLTNPRAGMAMIKSLGGLDAVQTRLEYAGAQARGATVEDLQNIALQREGAQGFAQIAAGRAAMNNATGAPGLDEVMKFRTQIRKDSEGYGTRRDFMIAAMQAADQAATSPDEFQRGGGDFVLVQAMGKLIDPDSVVRGEEGKLIIDAGDSKLKAFIHDAQRWYGKTGILSDQARLVLLEQINAQWEGSVREQSMQVDLHRRDMAENAGLTGRLAAIATPYGVDPANDGGLDLRINLNKFQGGATVDKVDSGNIGDVITAKNGNQYRIVADSTRASGKNVERIE